LLRFTRESVDLKSVEVDLAEGFQRLVRELLAPELPGLSAFAAGGKDGGIDLWSEGPPRAVVECKVVGVDTVPVVLARWRETADHLRTHLASPAGPTAGQAQYAPWYRTDRPIGRYLFCTSALLAGLGQVDRVRDEISAFFQDLASWPHLAHLAGLAVDVRHWG